MYHAVCSVREGDVTLHFPCLTNNSQVALLADDSWPWSSSNGTTIVISVLASLLGTFIIFGGGAAWAWAFKKKAEETVSEERGANRNLPRR